MTRDDRGPRRSVALAAVFACCLAVGLLVPPPVGAGDNATIFYAEPSEIDVDAGERATIDLVVSSHGDYAGDGLDNLSVALEYDPDVITVTDVEHGPMLGEGDPDAEVDGTAEIDDENGVVRIGQERTPSGDGAKTTATAATVTIEIADDAPATSERLAIRDAEAVLVSGYPQGTVERDATIRVEGGDGSVDDGAEADDPDGITLADDANESEGANESDAAADAAPDSDDPVPGFSAPAALVGIVALLVGARARR